MQLQVRFAEASASARKAMAEPNRGHAPIKIGAIHGALATAHCITMAGCRRVHCRKRTTLRPTRLLLKGVRIRTCAGWEDKSHP
jgi:hypothetical protein